VHRKTDSAAQSSIAVYVVRTSRGAPFCSDPMIITLFSIGATPARPAGLALVCAEARYASVQFEGVPRLDRRFGTTLIWRQALNDLRGDLGSD
jgi:hypothetical protein